MAGVYTDVPGHRFAYDVDGTLVKVKRSDGTFFSPANLTYMNDEDQTDELSWGYLRPFSNNGTIGAAGTHYLTFVFPQVRNLLGYYINDTLRITTMTWTRTALQYSADTTDGTDGTWTTFVTPWVSTDSSIPILPSMRTAIRPVSGVDNVKGVRFGVTSDSTNNDTRDYLILYCLHLYGTIVGATNGLRFWHPTIDQEVGPAYFDYGDLPQGTTSTKQFRLKNTHATLQANSIVLSAEYQSGSDSGLALGTTFSQDNTTYGTTTTVTSLAAATISPILYARRTVGSSEVQNLRSARFKAVATTWT